MQSETLAQEFARLVKEYHEGDDHTKTEAWNLLADYAVDNADAISAALSDKQAGEVKIKPLEWRAEPPYHVARVFGNVYAVEAWDGGVTLSGIGGRRDFKTVSEAKAAAQADYVQRIRRTLVDVPAVESDDDEETYQIGKRDGYSEAVQQIDRLTGGDGEYRFCTDHDPDRHTPGPAEMIQRIVDRFEALNQLDDASKTGRDQEWGLSREGEDSADASFMTLVSRYGDAPTQEGFDQIYRRYLSDCERAATRSGSATTAKGCAE